jgi:hypothetical protein
MGKLIFKVQVRSNSYLLGNLFHALPSPFLQVFPVDPKIITTVRSLPVKRIYYEQTFEVETSLDVELPKLEADVRYQITDKRLSIKWLLTRVLTNLSQFSF